MLTLKQEIDKLVKSKDITSLTELREAMEDTRESVSLSIEDKQDMWLSCYREQRSMKQINENINLVKEAINNIL